MNRRDIVIGLVVLVALGGILYSRSQNEGDMKVPDVKTEGASVESTLEEKLNVKLPDTATKAELKAVDNGDGSAIASVEEKDGNYTLTLLADLPEPEAGASYQGWIAKGEEGEDDYRLVSAGRLVSAKGGYVLNFQSKTDYQDHKKIVISQEKNSDSKIDKKVLEGSF